MKKRLTIVGLLIVTLAVSAQQMEIENFQRKTKGLLNFHHIVIDKQQAIIDLKTGEKGFSFLANGKTELAPEEADGGITLKVPHKTVFLTVKHPDYGQLTWKVPGKGLKKKQRYQAFLLTFSPDKQYKLQNQWVIFDIQPKNAIVTVDSTTQTTRTGILQLNLPIGKHSYKVESPFHQEEKGTFELEDTALLTMPVALQPFYSYLSVKTPLKDCRILLDGEWIGTTNATSGHLSEGAHRLTIVYANQTYYEADVYVGLSEKKTLELTSADLYPRETKKKWNTDVALTRALPQLQEHTDSLVLMDAQKAPEAPLVMAPVTIQAPDDSTEIWVDRECVGVGTWNGTLSVGFHAVSTKKEKLESRTTFLWVEDETPLTLDLHAPMTAYGLLNIHCNVVGAEVYINNVLAGTTPCVLENLPAGLHCQIKLCKKGFWEEKTEVQVIANDMVDVEMKMKHE